MYGLITRNYNQSILRLREYEATHSVDITALDIIEECPTNVLIYHEYHPTTRYFLNLLKKICDFIQIDYFSQDKYNQLIQQNNLMELPGYC